MSERLAGEQTTRIGPLRRPSQPKQNRDFHQTERGLTTRLAGDIARAGKKGGLNFLYPQLWLWLRRWVSVVKEILDLTAVFETRMKIADGLQ